MRWQRGSLKVAFLPKKENLAKRQKVAHSRQSLANVPMTWQRLPFESGDFGQNGKYCEHPPVSGKIQIRWQRGPLKVAIFTKMTNMVRIRQSLSYNWNKIAKRSPLNVAILPKILKMAKIHQSVRKNWNEMAKWPLESDDLDENGEFDVNDKYGKRSPKSKEKLKWDGKVAL